MPSPLNQLPPERKPEDDSAAQAPDSFEELRAVLLRDERRAIAELGARLENRQQRRVDVGSVLPEALREANQQQGVALIEAMRSPVVEAISVSARREHERLSDALAPVMGPAILRAVTDTLRRYTESIEVIARNNLTLRGFQWRWESYRSGVPFAEIVLKHTLLYRIEQVFLIHKPSGLLITHAAYPGLPQGDDKDAIAGMMSAIQNFARDALTTDQSDSLEAVDLGGRMLRLFQGPHAMLAFVSRGSPPNSFFDRAREALDEIHRLHHYDLLDFPSELAVSVDAQTLLEPLLVEDNLDSAQAKEKPPVRHYLIWLALGCTLVLAWSLWRWHEGHERARLMAAKLLQQQTARAALLAERQHLRDALENLPGLVVANVEREGDQWTVSGLVDPMGPSPTDISSAVGMEATQLRLKLRPYLSLDAPLLLKRATAVLAPPPSVHLTVSGSSLVVEGEAFPEWIAMARYHARVHLPPYFEQVDLSGLNAKGTRKRTQDKK